MMTPSSFAGFPQLLIAIVAILAGTWLLGALAVRLRQPAVVGHIIAGVLLGASGFGIVNPHGPMLQALSDAGAVMLLFAAGLHTERGALLRIGRPATMVAIAGLVVPFILGYAVTQWFGATWIESLVAGGAMCATSADISTRVLARLGRTESAEGRIVAGAAVIDDVIGLAILAVVMSLVATGPFTMETFIRTALLPAAFLAGLMIDSAGANGRVERVTRILSALLVPFFFAVAGALLDLRALGSGSALGLEALLVAGGIVGKLIAGWAPAWISADKLLIGVAMIPRGEMGVIFGQTGLAAGAIDQRTFGAILLLVVVTTLMTPPLLSAIVHRHRSP
jgi:Kef-type K+ transport system membrane component KefB